MLTSIRPRLQTLRVNTLIANLHKLVIAPAVKSGTAPATKKFVHRQIAQHPALAPTQKSVYSPLHQSSSANIASSRTDAITRHLSTGSQSQSPSMSYGKAPSEFGARQIAPKHTLDYRCYIEKDGTPVSPFHDVPLYANEQQTILNMVVEIPRWTNAKLEVRQGAKMGLSTGTDKVVDLKRRVPEPHQTRHQEGQASIRAQLLPPQGLSLELRCFPKSTSNSLLLVTQC